MSTPSYAELVAALRQEGEGIVAAARLGTGAPVSTCPGWTVGDLASHVGRVYRFAAEVLESRARVAGYPPGPGPEADPVDYLQDGLEEIITALVELSPDTPVWNWSNQPDLAAFWARRMTHESLIHRYDAERAHEVATTIDIDLAVDGIDEVFDAIAPRMLGRRTVPGLDGTLRLVASDADGQWSAKLAPDSISVTRGPGGGDLTVRGRTADLLLLLYNRGDCAECELTGAQELLTVWRDHVHF